MSTRRHLVSRARQNEASSPAPQSSRPRQSRGPQEEVQPTPLPPYEPPSCPLLQAAKQKLDTLNLDYTKYKTHLQASTAAISSATGECNERLSNRLARVAQNAEKKASQNIEGEEKLAEFVEAEKYCKIFEKQVKGLTSEADEALRELVDWGDELAIQRDLLREAAEKAMAAGERAPAEDAELQSASEALAEAKEKYAADYATKTMRERYTENNDYKNFKRVVHDAQNSSIENAPPLAHPRTWFPEENTKEVGSSRRRRNKTTDNTSDGGDEEDEEIIISGIKENLKCPLTFQYLKEPMTCNKCKHSYEKEAITEYFNTSAQAFYITKDRQRVPTGEKTAGCPQSGCDARFEMGDLFLDRALQRRVELANRRERRAAENDEDEDEDMAGPRGTQAGRPEEIGDEDEVGDGIEIDDDEQRRREILKVKKERAKSRGPSVAPRRSQDEGEEEDEMEID